jgi:hypothetical protein
MGTPNRTDRILIASGKHVYKYTSAGTFLASEPTKIFLSLNLITSIILTYSLSLTMSSLSGAAAGLRSQPASQTQPINESSTQEAEPPQSLCLSVYKKNWISIK